MSSIDELTDDQLEKLIDGMSDIDTGSLQTKNAILRETLQKQGVKMTEMIKRYQFAIHLLQLNDVSFNKVTPDDDEAEYFVAVNCIIKEHCKRNKVKIHPAIDTEKARAKESSQLDG